MRIEHFYLREIDINSEMTQSDVSPVAFLGQKSKRIDTISASTAHSTSQTTVAHPRQTAAGGDRENVRPFSQFGTHNRRF